MTSSTDRLALEDLLSLAGKVAVVTGGAQGIGRTIAERLAEAGALVAVFDLDASAASAAAAALEGPGVGRHWGAGADVTDARSLDRRAVELLERFGRLDVWVNNAGIYPITPIWEADAEDFDRPFAVNARGVFFGCRTAARAMRSGKANDSGVIVNVASTAPLRAAHPDMFNYAASKAGTTSITASAAAAFGPFGIRVVGVAPSLALTEGVQHVYGGLQASGAGFDQRAAQLPLRRLSTPDEIARVVLFGATDLAAYVTGITIALDGGALVLGGAAAPGGAEPPPFDFAPRDS